VEQMKRRKSTSLRNSHVARYAPVDFTNMSSAEEEYEEEEEEDEEEKYAEYEQNPFTPSNQQNYDVEEEEDNETRCEIQQLNSQVKTLDTLTLLVIQETLLEDFIIKNKADQNKELNNIGEVKKMFKNDVKNNEQSAEASDEEEKKIDSDQDNIEEVKEVEDEQVQGGPEEQAAKNSLKTVKFELLIKQILLPFFQIQTRILKKSTIFEIGSIKFLVAATTPFKQGKVGTKTKIRCNMVVSRDIPLESVELIPMRRNAISSNSTFMDEVVTPFLRTIKPSELYTHKHATIELDDVRFLIKYARPFFGYF